MIVLSEADNYVVQFNFESGVPPGNDLGYFSSQAFSTYDRDNDQSGDDECAKKCGAGFWYGNCDDGNPRGTINQHSSSVCGGFTWDKFNPIIELQETKLYLSCDVPQY